jgi:enoyl-CoA hydratase/carnithine racemase
MPDTSPASLIVVRVADGIAHLRLNRPDKRNAISAAMASEIHHAMSDLDNDPAVVGIVVEGTDGAFSAGADMTESLAAYERGDRRFNPSAEAAARVAASPKPTIAAIDGPAYGAGALLACACDVRVITARTRFRFPGAEYGLVVGAAGLSQLIAPALAKELIFTSRVVEAEEAGRIGLANRVVPAEDLDATVDALAAQIAQGSPLAAAWAKRVIDAGDGTAAAALEAQADLALRGGPDHRERFAHATQRVTGRGASS